MSKLTCSATVKSTGKSCTCKPLKGSDLCGKHTPKDHKPRSPTQTAIQKEIDSENNKITKSSITGAHDPMSISKIDEMPVQDLSAEFLTVHKDKINVILFEKLYEILTRS